MKKEIAFRPNTAATEQLPLPIVLYPGHYGAFFAFKNTRTEQPFFCSCSYEAIENYVKLRTQLPIPQNASPHRMYILDSFHFPLSIVESLMHKQVSARNVIAELSFGDRLCHECNAQIPLLRYCHEMYGGTFKQNYGWYINKQSFEWGIDPISRHFLDDCCPEEIVSLIKLAPDGTIEEDRKDLQKQYRNLDNIIENEVRSKFGHKQIGEAWTSETILYYIVKQLFPNYTVRRHYRPHFLEGLELDIFIDELAMGVEYQGVQHYKPVKHWGGEPALSQLRKRDRLKKKLCDLNDIRLVYFKYDDGLNDELVKQRLLSTQ